MTAFVVSPATNFTPRREVASAMARWAVPSSRAAARRNLVVRASAAAPSSTASASSSGGSGTSATTAPSLDPLPEIKPVATPHDLATGRNPARVKVFDTTLRDGEQSPGATLTADEKLVIAKQLAKLGVDVIEAGFPIASEGDFEAVKMVAQTVGNRENPPIICGLARALKPDIDRCWDAIKGAAFPRIHTFIASSDIHMEHKLKKSRAEVLAIAKDMVTHARSLCEDVEFSAEDATRSDPEFLYELYKVAIECGATTINVPDTVGYVTPSEFSDLITKLRHNVPALNSGKITISVHGHDDLGMAVANFMAAIEAGARQVECTINGIGERAGNAALEEIVMALHVRRGYYNSALSRSDDSTLTNIDKTELYPSSRMVSKLTGMSVQPNKAIVGSNAFAHESGIHQDGVLKNRLTYEIMDARSIGLSDNSIVLGKHSGRHALRSRLTELGYELSQDELNRAFVRFKELADKKKEVTTWDLQALVADEVMSSGLDTLQIEQLQVLCGQDMIPTATVSLASGSSMSMSSETGTGPVDAAYKAVNSCVPSFTDSRFVLLEYSVNSVTNGIDAMGEVAVRVRETTSGASFTGNSAATDVVVASVRAYVQAINRALASETREPQLHPQKS